MGEGVPLVFFVLNISTALSKFCQELSSYQSKMRNHVSYTIHLYRVFLS